jgi:hypothetical protein
MLQTEVSFTFSCIFTHGMSFPSLQTYHQTVSSLFLLVCIMMMMMHQTKSLPHNSQRNVHGLIILMVIKQCKTNSYQIHVYSHFGRPSETFHFVFAILLLSRHCHRVEVTHACNTQEKLDSMHPLARGQLCVLWIRPTKLSITDPTLFHLHHNKCH